MAKTLGLLGVLVVVALLARPETSQEHVDRAVRRGITHLKMAPSTGPHASSTHSLDERWIVGRRLRRWIDVIQTLKGVCWKGMVSASYSK